MKILELTAEIAVDLNKANEPFEIIGKIVPKFDGFSWTYAEELYEQPYTKSYPDDEWEIAEYIGNPDKTAFLAYDGGTCIGQIVLRRDWNKYAFIEDICVAAAARHHGVGSALISKAVEWAKERKLCGLALETQDNNLTACRFYAKCGFEIGAVNTMLYRNFEKPWSDETAIFWYLRF